VPAKEQPWKTKFGLARSAFERKGSKAPVALFHAIDEAYQVVDTCYGQLSRLRREPLEESTFSDWEDFLLTLDAVTNLCMEPASVQLDINMQTTFESIRRTARGALLQLQDMYAATPALP